jgi:hypothetical protein
MPVATHRPYALTIVVSGHLPKSLPGGGAVLV